MKSKPFRAQGNEPPSWASLSWSHSPPAPFLGEKEELAFSASEDEINFVKCRLSRACLRSPHREWAVPLVRWPVEKLSCGEQSDGDE